MIRRYGPVTIYGKWPSVMVEVGPFILCKYGPPRSMITIGFWVRWRGAKHAFWVRIEGRSSWHRRYLHFRYRKKEIAT